MNEGDFFDPEQIEREDRRAAEWLRDKARAGEDLTRWRPGWRLAARRERREER